MTDILNINVRENPPEKILFNDVYTPKADVLFTKEYFHKYSSDGGGYYVRGLWLAPYGPQGVYSWPWDLSVANGALKDVNEGARYWGYIQDGSSKNITSGINTSFPANVSGNQRICISLWSSNANYTDEEGNSFIDFGDVPIVITFLDDRFDNYTWVGNTGAIYEWSEDKRTITIYRVPASEELKANSWVCRSDISDVSIEKVRADLTNVYTIVTGLSTHYDNTAIAIDPSTKECWDIKLGDDIIYHKDKTVSNAWVDYDLATVTVDTKNNIKDADYTKLTDIRIKVANNISYNSINLPILADFDAEMKEFHQREIVGDTFIVKSVLWNIKFSNLNYWNTIKQWYKKNTATVLVNLFANSNLSGDITLNISDNYYTGTDTFANTNVQNITLNLGQSTSITSANSFFRNAKSLETVTVNVLTDELWTIKDISGMFEWCNALKSLPINMYFGNDNTTDYGDAYPCMPTGYFLEGCSLITTVPCNNNNTINPSTAEQMFNQCAALVTIEPVIDCKVLDPRRANNMFTGCSNLTTAKLQHLNHGDWIFDGVTRDITIDETTKNVVHGNLINLDTESIQYLFENLVDLSLHDNAVPIDIETITTSPKSATAKLYCPAAWFLGGTSFDFTTMSLGEEGCESRTSTVLVLTKRRLTSSSTALIYLQGSQNNSVKFKIEGLTSTDILGIGAGDYSAIANKITTDGTYSFTFTSTWGFKLWNADTSITSPVTITSLPTEGDTSKVTDAMINSANAKGWIVYNNGTIV